MFAPPPPAPRNSPKPCKSHGERHRLPVREPAHAGAQRGSQQQGHPNTDPPEPLGSCQPPFRPAKRHPPPPCPGATRVPHAGGCSRRQLGAAGAASKAQFSRSEALALFTATGRATGPPGQRGCSRAKGHRVPAAAQRAAGGGAKKPVPSTYSPLILVQPLALEMAATHGRAVQGRIWPPALPLPSVPEPGGAGATPGAIPAQRRGQLSVPGVCPCLSTLCCSRPGILGFLCKPELPQWWRLVLPSRNPLSKSASQKSHIPVQESYRVPCKGRRVFGNCCKWLGGNLDCSLGTHSPGSTSCCEAVEGFLPFPKPGRGCAQTSLKLGLRRSPAPASSRGGAGRWAPRGHLLKDRGWQRLGEAHTPAETFTAKQGDAVSCDSKVFSKKQSWKQSTWGELGRGQPSTAPGLAGTQCKAKISRKKQKAKPPVQGNHRTKRALASGLHPNPPPP